MSALIPLHPGYADVTALDKHELAPLKSPNIRLSESNIKLNFPVLMPPVKPTALDGAIGSDSISFSENAGLTTLDNSNKIHIQRIMDRERSTLHKRLITEVAQEKERLLSIPNPVAPSKDFTTVRNQVRKLIIEQIALESDARVLTIPGIVPITDRLTAINAEIDILRQKLRPVQIVSDNSYVDEGVTKYKQSKEAALDRAMVQRSITLHREGDTLLQSVKSRMLGNASAIKRVDSVEVSPPLIMPRMPKMTVKTGVPKLALNSSLHQNTKIVSPVVTNSNNAMREQMLSFIKVDLQRRVDRMALKNHWRITYVDTNKGNDLTDKVAAMLAADFSGRDLAE